MSPANDSAARAAIRRMTPAGFAAVAAMAFALVLIAGALPGLWRAARFSSPETDTVARDQQARAERYAESLEDWRAQVEGRSMFFVPPAPPPPPREESPVADRGPAPPPSSYAGPRIVAIVGSTVWFDNGDTVKAGDEASGAVKVLSVSPPWSARVVWRGAEFDVPLFDRTTDQFLQPTPDPIPADGPTEARSPNSPQQGGL